jgi:quinol monooxygenase YgiN
LLQELGAAAQAHADHPAVQALQALALDCLSEQPRQRPNAAEVAARIVEKVRVNPGNYADKMVVMGFGM